MAKQLVKDGHEVHINGSDNDYDIVDIHFLFNVPKLKEYNKKFSTVVHVHSTPQDMYGGIFGYELINWIATPYIRNYYNHAKLLLPVSKFTVKSLREIGVFKPAIPISNGVDRNKFMKRTGETYKLARNELVKRYNLNPQKPVVGCIGSIFPRKGIFETIELAKALPDLQILWVGSYQTIYPKFILKPRIDRSPPNFQLTGYLKSVIDFYHGIDFLFVASRLENQGLPILEAASTLTPIIARDLEVYDWLNNNHNSLLFKDLKTAISSIKILLEKSELGDKLSYNAYRDSSSHEISVVSKKLCKIYKSL
jgi:1,2-diacylglycerol-3-alpha-glucose alpha-1,2-glucosyltransferase